MQSRRRRNCIHMVVFLIEDIFQGDGCPSCGGHQTESKGMSRICQKEVISQLFQENQVWHREIMSIVTNQALDAILTQQIVEQIFAFAPSSSRPYAQCRQEQVRSEEHTSELQSR